jgi:predicted MFS family arabinose efflux permease
MVIPFLSLYLTQSKGFSLGQVAWIMVAFGVGSVCGSWIGGFLTDKLGAYKTMIFSLLSSGFAYIVLQYMDAYYSIMLAVFVVLLLADIFRPAMFVILKAYSKPENQTRSLTLIRLALNLGFSLGPVLGGFLIYNLSYGSLFWVDGLSCLAAVILLFIVLRPRRGVKQIEEVHPALDSPYKDRLYILFCVGLVMFGFVFLQYFSTVPLFYRDIFDLNEQSIGLLLGFNGLLVFLIEMPLVQALDKSGNNKIVFLVWGMVLLLLSFLIMIFFPYIIMLWVAIVLMSFSEMLFFPFSNAFAHERTRKGNTGQYMALYSMSFSVAHIFGHSAGLQMVSYFDFTFAWWTLVVISGIGMLIFLIIGKRNQQLHAENV